MTDEELADKYVEEYFGKKTELVELWKVKSYKDAFLAGLKAGRPEWHDLRKDPNDLPKVVKEYITNIGVMTFDRLKDRYLWTTPLCDACDYYEEVTDEVIAWCEIPQFKDKE